MQLRLFQRLLHIGLLQCYAQQPSDGNSQDAPLLKNGLRKCGIYTQWNFYSATKKNEVLSFASKWMKLENLILSEVSQAQKAKNPMFSLICRL
jgi:hypothetical protein